MTQRRTPVEDPGIDKKFNGKVSSGSTANSTMFDLRNYGGGFGRGTINSASAVSRVYSSSARSDSSTSLSKTTLVAASETQGFFRPLNIIEINNFSRSADATLKADVKGSTRKFQEFGGWSAKMYLKNSTGATVVTNSFTTPSLPVTTKYNVPQSGSMMLEVKPANFEVFLDVEYSNGTTVATDTVFYPFYATEAPEVEFEANLSRSVTGDWKPFVGFGSFQKINFDSKTYFG